MRVVLGRSGWMIGSGLLLGAALAWGSTRLLEGVLFGVRPHDPGTFVGVASLLALAALLASLLPALKASGVDPMVALRRD